MGKLTSKMHSENITVHLLSGAATKRSDQKQPRGGKGLFHRTLSSHSPKPREMGRDSRQELEATSMEEHHYYTDSLAQAWLVFCHIPDSPAKGWLCPHWAWPSHINQ